MDAQHSPFWLPGGHLQTIIPGLFRSVVLPSSPRPERLELPDGDFLEYDFYPGKNHQMVIISHGLEGNSRRPYITGMVRQLLNAGYAVLAWNYRSCGHEMNRTLRFYHSGATDDLNEIVRFSIEKFQPKSIHLIGFSLGGNIILKYLGEYVNQIPAEIKSSASVSVPIHLESGSENLQRGLNVLYSRRFLKSLKQKVMVKEKMYPGSFDLERLKKVNTIREFDEHFTSRIHGFNGASDYYTRCSSLYFLPEIKVPSLIINALNDPMLTDKSYPKNLTGKSSVRLEITKSGGHCGFVQTKLGESNWVEKRISNWILDN